MRLWVQGAPRETGANLEGGVHSRVDSSALDGRTQPARSFARRAAQKNRGSVKAPHAIRRT